MKTARDFIGVVVELTARVQDRHNNLSGGDTLLMHIRRYAAAIVRNCDRFIRMNHHIYLGAVARQSLIDRVINELKNHVMQPGAIVCVADVHTRALPNSVQAL